MTKPQMTRLAEQITSFQCKLMALPLGTGYGYVGIGEHAPYDSWWTVFCRESGWDRTQGSRSGTLRDLRSRVRLLTAQYESYLKHVPSTCFLDDITVKNVMMDGGELTGLVDFDGVCYGDPLYWLGLTAAGVVSEVGRLELYYVRELCRCLGLRDEQVRMVMLYAAWIVLGFVERYADAETPEWHARMMAAAEAWVIPLEQGRDRCLLLMC